MASVTNVGVPGQPATNLTAWQIAVRDALNSKDQTVDARIAAIQTLTTWTPAAPWVDYGSSLGGLYLTRTGRIVTLEANLKPTSQQSLTAGVGVTVGTVAAAHSAAHGMYGTAYVAHSSGSAIAGVFISGTTVQLLCTSALTIPTSGIVGILVTYRTAS